MHREWVQILLVVGLMTSFGVGAATIALATEAAPETAIGSLAGGILFGAFAGVTIVVLQAPIYGPTGPIFEMPALSERECKPIPTADRVGRAPQASDLWLAFLQQGPDEVRDAVAVCGKTVPVEALQKPILGAGMRLADKGGDPIVVLEAESGFGKSNSMLALYQIFSFVPASRLPRMGGFIGSDGVPNPLKVRHAVLLGDRISPANPHHKPDGTMVRTLWGELAWQLGGRDGYEMLRESDERAVSPGGSLVSLLQRYSPCLILAGELPAYALRLQQNSGFRADAFDEHLAFVKALAHAVRLTASNLLVVQLPARTEGHADASQAPLIDQLWEALDAPGPNRRYSQCDGGAYDDGKRKSTHAPA